MFRKLNKMTPRTKIAVKLLASHIFLSAGLVIAAVFVRNCDFLLVPVAQTVLLLVYFAGYWEFFGLRFKNIYFVSLEMVLATVLVRKLIYGFSGEINLYLLPILSILQAIMLVQLVKVLIVIFNKDKLFMNIEFPFRGGTYLITDGGNSRISRLMNYHYYSPVHRKNKTNLSMLYATDIVRLSDREPLWLPRENGGYPVFGENVYSPVDGRILKTVNDIADNKPFEEDFPYNTGNTVVIRKDDYYFLLGHLKEGSIVVKEGDLVKANDLIGTAGNSGWTERPHIHIQQIRSDSEKYWTGTGVEIRFRGQTLVKNRLIRN